MLADGGVLVFLSGDVSGVFHFGEVRDKGGSFC